MLKKAREKIDNFQEKKIGDWRRIEQLHFYQGCVHCGVCNGNLQGMDEGLKPLK